MAQEKKDDASCVLQEFAKPISTEGVEGDVVIEEEQFKRLSRSICRKLDMTLMPMVWIMYVFNYLDRNNISAAKLNSIEADLGLVSDQYNTVVSILNVGYILMQLPSNLLLTRARPSLYLPFWVCVWSCISATTAAARNYTDLIVIRFFLGIAEAPFFPGVFYLLSCWYTKKELALRAAILNSGLVLATAFSNLIAVGVFSGLDGVRGLAGWRWLFIIDGAASFTTGLVALFLLPNFPGDCTASARWLFTAQEREVSVLRIKRERVAQEEGGRSVWYGAKLAAADYRTWVFVLMLVAQHTSYGFNYFYPTIVKGFNLGSTTVTLALTAPPYILATICSLIIAYSSDRLQERGWHISMPMLVAAVGFIISAATLNTPVRYFASFLYVSGCFSANAGVWGWAGITLNQTPEKRAAAIAIINLLAQLGNIWSPYFFRPQDSPRYVLAMILMMIFCFISVATCVVMKWSLRRRNAKLLSDWDGHGERPTMFVL